MAMKAVQFVCVVSFVLCGITILLFALSFVLNPWDHRISFTDDFHVGLMQGQVVFFSDAEPGPYLGSIIGIVDENGNVYPPLEREIGWGETLGVYFRYFRWTDSDSTLWTLTVSLWWPLTIFGLPSAFPLCLRWRSRVASRQIG